MEWASDRYLLSADIGPAIKRTRPYIGDWWRTGAI
ncbi:hypothetical protein MetexDRAFT_2381 [Methylorubrum extorquens DSM 13060]|jgi:hypothetical protein|uniref:Uncharacterized protein n=1 Tax=Methylorubrum extorquens DSM 13060 TaxID=882800 RepID=H1KIB9_METEX|nr:hypothetical protein MetexDRAFT_2381 [Methylorubrum extorquens DSM 13060]